MLGAVDFTLVRGERKEPQACGAVRVTVLLLVPQTRVGKRLLRATLISPSNDPVTINTRLDAVQELLGNSDLFFGCAEVQRCTVQCYHGGAHTVKFVPTQILPKFSDLDRLLGDIVQVPKHLNAKSAKRAIDCVILLKHALTIVNATQCVPGVANLPTSNACCYVTRLRRYQSWCCS